ncbi:unnamed protein product [Nezara viridula]|uniref:Uncharacterized protein n=1 Tax=Nezara viridula TaxID=85310 RepID=A0A9P0HU76_NEZVI|nr:unnamed protein product [Nezara viridula]
MERRALEAVQARTSSPSPGAFFRCYSASEASKTANSGEQVRTASAAHGGRTTPRHPKPAKNRVAPGEGRVPLAAARQRSPPTLPPLPPPLRHYRLYLLRGLETYIIFVGTVRL